MCSSKPSRNNFKTAFSGLPPPKSNRDLEGGNRTPNDHRAGVLALSWMECQGEALDANGQVRNFYAKYAECDRGAGGVGSTGGIDPPLQVSQTGQQRWVEITGESLDAPIASKEGAPSRDPDAFDPFLSLVSDHGSSQASHQSGESRSGPADQSVQQPIQAEAIAGWLTSLRLGNDGHQCYQNAFAVSLLWCLTQMGSAMWQDFGHLYHLIEELFTQESLCINLQQLNCFEPLLLTWGNRQQDAGEFLAAFLRWTQPLCVHLQWKRRMQIDHVVETADEGSRFTPPTVSAPATVKKIGLQQLVDSWASGTGMSTAFVHSGKLVNLHLDRYCSAHSGEVRRHDWELELPDVVLLPVQAEDLLTTCAIPYVVVGGILHRGEDSSGHTQAIGRSREGWYLFNDNEEARFFTDPPLLSSWVSVWLVRDVWTRFITPKFWQFGLDHMTDQMTIHLETEGLDWDAFRGDWIQRLRAHCSMCGRLTLSHRALAKHVRARRPEYVPELLEDTNRQLDKRLSSLPCLGCGMKPMPGAGLCTSHMCIAELNLHLGRTYTHRELRSQSSSFGIRDSPDLATWLERH